MTDSTPAVPEPTPDTDAMPEPPAAPQPDHKAILESLAERVRAAATDLLAHLADIGH